MLSNSTQNAELVSIANAQVPEILDALGVTYSRGGSWLSSPCPVHKGDNSHGFGFNVDKGYWNCFSHGCHIEWGTNIIGLVAGVLGYSYDDSVQWLSENTKEVSHLKPKTERKEDKVYREDCLKRLFKTHFYTKRGFSQETVDAFEHGQAQSGRMAYRVVFPIRDGEGRIRGFSGRWGGLERQTDGNVECVSNTGKVVAKWKHTSFSKSSYLYNFYRIKDTCQDELILVESIGNVMRFWEAGKKNCVAVMGSSLSIVQAKLILASKAKNVILAFDNDEAGKKCSKKALKMLEQHVNTKIIFPTEGKDWSDMTNEEVLKIYGSHTC